tara:strand:+ start:1211 stop:1555 length:345 start_codon:yes stop_codon:yes gene_type:complete
MEKTVVLRVDINSSQTFSRPTTAFCVSAVATADLIVAYLAECNNLCLSWPGYQGLPLTDIHVYLGPHTEFATVDTWFDCEARARQQTSIIVSFVVVQMHSIAVDLFTEAVSSAM